jgi:hypothetical protein
VVVEYDGPSLSDAGSVLNFNASEEGSSRGGVEWGEGRDTRSRSSWTSGSSQSWRQEDDVPAGTRVVIEEDDDWDDEPIDLTRDPFLPGHNGISNHIPAPTSPHPLSQAHYPESARSSSSPSSRSSASPSPTRSYASSSHHNTQGNVPRTDHDLQSSSPASQISFNHRDSRASFDQPPSHSSDRFSSPLTPSDPRTISSDHLPALSSHHSQVSATDPEDSKRSDFSARWVKEQTALLARRNNPNPLSIVSSSSSSSSFTSSSRQSSSSRSADGDDDEPNRSSLAISTSDLGSLELQQDDRGRWYYAYTTSSPLIPQSDSSRNSPSDTHPRHQQLEQQPDPQLSLVSLHPSSSHPFMSSSKGKAAASSSRPTSVGSSRQLIGSTDQRWLDTFDSALGSEISDVVPCSGCGIEIGYMRYTCIVVSSPCQVGRPTNANFANSLSVSSGSAVRPAPPRPPLRSTPGTIISLRTAMIFPGTFPHPNWKTTATPPIRPNTSPLVPLFLFSPRIPPPAASQIPSLHHRAASTSVSPASSPSVPPTPDPTFVARPLPFSLPLREAAVRSIMPSAREYGRQTLEEELGELGRMWSTRMMCDAQHVMRKLTASGTNVRSNFLSYFTR